MNSTNAGLHAENTLLLQLLQKNYLAKNLAQKKTKKNLKDSQRYSDRRRLAFLQ